MEKSDIDKIDATLQRMADEFSASVAGYMASTGLPERQAKSALWALGSLRASKERISAAYKLADVSGTSTVEVLIDGKPQGTAFLAGSMASADDALSAAEKADFLSAFVAACHLIRDLELAFDFMASESRQEKASHAANVRHLADRKRKSEAKDLFLSRGWRYKADAAREIEKSFHVSYKTAERWVIEWTRPAEQEGDSP